MLWAPLSLWYIVVLVHKAQHLTSFSSIQWTYLPADAPDYHQGNSLNLGTTSAICLFTIIGAIYIRWENEKRTSGQRDYRLEGKTAKELEELGNRHPAFRYQL